MLCLLVLLLFLFLLLLLLPFITFATHQYLHEIVSRFVCSQGCGQRGEKAAEEWGGVLVIMTHQLRDFSCDRCFSPFLLICFFELRLILAGSQHLRH